MSGRVKDREVFFLRLEVGTTHLNRLALVSLWKNDESSENYATIQIMQPFKKGANSGNPYVKSKVSKHFK